MFGGKVSPIPTPPSKSEKVLAVVIIGGICLVIVAVVLVGVTH